MKPIRSYPLLSDQVSYTEVAIILRELQAVLVASGSVAQPAAVVEFGCYVGTTAVFMQRLLQDQAPHWRLHVYDSFAGLPNKSVADASTAGEQFKPGELTASKATLIANFKHAGLTLPVIRKAWFSQLTDTDVPDNIAFAFLDGDYYRSITDSLRLVTPRLLPGATIVVDDYQSSALPGATKAVDEWLGAHPSWRMHHEQSLAILKER